MISKRLEWTLLLITESVTCFEVSGGLHRSWEIFGTAKTAQPWSQDLCLWGRHRGSETAGPPLVLTLNGTSAKQGWSASKLGARPQLGIARGTVPFPQDRGC